MAPWRAPRGAPAARAPAGGLLPPAPLPGELWGRAAPWLLPVDFARLCGCAPRLLIPQEKQRLWRSFCHARGYAWAVDTERNVTTGWHDECGWPGPEVDWQRSFRANAVADASGYGYAFARVLVRDAELRVPCPVGAGDDGQASPQRAWLCEHGWRTVASLSHALEQMLLACETPLRFRELIAGRPGFLLRRAAFYPGGGPASAMVEWPVGGTHDAGWRWRLPPYGPGAAVEAEEGEDRGFVPGPHPWGRGSGWLLDLVTEAPAGAAAAAPRHRWVVVGGSKPAAALTLRELCEELREHLPGGLAPGARVRLAGARGAPRRPEPAQPQWLLHGDLRWTQGEQLRLLAPEEAAPEEAAPEAGAPEEAAARREGGAPRPRALVLQRAALPRPLGRCAGAEGLGSLGGLEGQGGVALPHARRLLLASSGARQFEFHPTRPATMLTGRKDGVVAVVDHEADVQTHVLEVDSYPILGLAWLHTQPQWAVVGASQSGTTCVVRHDESKPGCMEHVKLEPFRHLSSLSVNCTDDYFMTSGFCVDLGLYDIVTGRRLETFRGLHQNFINILRFAHQSPHLFATASFDHTCKVWDLRVPVTASHPVRFFHTDTLNVMCCFSPDDRSILCSGVDQALQQFSLHMDHNAAGSRFPLPSLHSDTNYRRSLYFGGGALVATAATNESLLRVYGAEAPHAQLGRVDFRGALPRPAAAAAAPGAGAGARPAARAGGAEPAEPAEREYVQSLRAHPGDPLLLGALLSTSEPQPESYVATLRLER